MLKEAVTNTLGAYIDKRQAILVEWIVLRTIIEICDSDTGYKGGESLRETWWRQTAARKQLSVTLKDILESARARRCGKGGEGRGVAESDAGSDGPWYAGMEIDDAWVVK